jgi:hypothetical protein
MMRVFSIIAIVASLILVIGTVGFIHVVDSDRSAASYEMYSSSSSECGSSDSMYDSYRAEAASYTVIGTVFSLGILVFLETVYLFSLLKIKTKTMKIISIIGLSLCGILIFFSFIPISSPSACSFNEVGAFYTLFGIVSIALFIIGTIHAFRVKA